METDRPDKVVRRPLLQPGADDGLVEIVRPLTASPTRPSPRHATFAAACGKSPVEVKDRAGFIVNALLFPYLNNAVRMLENGTATRDDIDAAMKGGCNFPMGPLALLDLVGLDTSLAILDALYDEFRDPNYSAVPLLRRMVSRRPAGPQVRLRLLRLPQVAAPHLTPSSTSVLGTVIGAYRLARKTRPQNVWDGCARVDCRTPVLDVGRCHHERDPSTSSPSPTGARCPTSVARGSAASPTPRRPPAPADAALLRATASRGISRLVRQPRRPSEQGVLGAVLAAGPDVATLSHRTAGRLHGLVDGSTLEAMRRSSVPAAPRMLEAAMRSCCTGRSTLLRATSASIDGVPVTTIERTLADLGDVVPLTPGGVGHGASGHRSAHHHRPAVAAARRPRAPGTRTAAAPCARRSRRGCSTGARPTASSR